LSAIFWIVAITWATTEGPTSALESVFFIFFQQCWITQYCWWVSLFSADESAFSYSMQLWVYFLNDLIPSLIVCWKSVHNG
jgi:hypothetical protein